MYDIDEIMDMLDWNNSPEVQKKGIELAKNIRSINVFLQPGDKTHNKNVWDNCAKILANRTDEELSPYLSALMAWLEDLNWLGALCILKRLNEYQDNESLNFSLKESVYIATATKNVLWLSNLLRIGRK